MDRGYIKLWRKTVDSRIFDNEGLLKIWLWCLMSANHKKKWVSINVGRSIIEVLVERGSFIFGRNSAATKLRMSPSTVWKRMQKLKKTQNLNIKSNKHYSLISIVNWDTYQGVEEQGDSKGDYQVTTRGQPGDTTKNDKNEENDKKKKRYSAKFERFWKAYPNKTGKKPSWEKWQKMNSTRPPIQVLLTAIETQRQSRKWKEGFIPNPLTWISQERWDDEMKINSLQGVVSETTARTIENLKDLELD